MELRSRRRGGPFYFGLDRRKILIGREGLGAPLTGLTISGTVLPLLVAAIRGTKVASTRPSLRLEAAREGVP